MNAGSFEYLGKKYAKFKNNYWMLLLHHNYTESGAFEDINEAINSSDKDKYSILYLLNDEYRTKKHNLLKYEFIINWPNLSYYFQWRQNNNPLDEDDIIGIKEASGYEPIHIDKNYFGGLARDKNFSETLLNGQLGSAYWCVSIGMLKTANEFYIKRGFPAACEPTNIVDLWIKIPFTSFASKCYSHYSSSIYSFKILCFIIIITS